MHFDWTVSFGNIVSCVAFIIMALFWWRDMDWRVRNLEVWRKEHMVDEDARDELIRKMDKTLDHVRWQTQKMLGGSALPPKDVCK